VQPTNTLAPTATFTTQPTDTPTSAPTPLGGGGKLFFTAYRSLFGGDFAGVPGDFNVYAANPDGSQLTPLTQGPEGTNNFFAGLSPDGQQALYYSTINPTKKVYADDNRVDLWVANLSGSSSIKLNPVDVHSYLGGATWGPDGSVYFVGWDMDGLGLFHAGSDGSNLNRVSTPVSLAPTGKAEILFFDHNKIELFWVTGGYCNDTGLCSARYYRTALDGTDQQQVWKWLKGARDRIALSPDGKWIAYQMWLTNQIPESYKNGCYVASFDGAKIEQMPGKHTSCYVLPHQTDFWSPDGQSIVYSTSDGDLKKYPLHLFSVAQETVTDLPDIQTSACEEVHWLPDGARILLGYCRSNYGGYDDPTSNRLLDLSTGAITAYPGSDYCEISFSPDGRSAFFYNCHSEGVGEVKFRFYTLDLETSTLTPLFTDALNASGEKSYWTFYAPLPWQAWSR
jgi:Tol biopolymer transport system component